ncbi:hypothetical protein [Microbulbifer agarilyticus]
MANDHWEATTLVGRLWAFYGPWMSGCKGELVLSVSVVGRSSKYRMGAISLFNPNAFELVLMKYLNERYGHHNWEGELSHLPRFQGPIDWQAHTHFPVPSASYQISRGTDLKRVVRPKYIFVFPVTNEHFVEVCFEREIYSFDLAHKPTFDLAPIIELQDAILRSFSLELGPEAQADVDQVKAEIGSLQMCNDFAPLRWPTNVYPAESRAAPGVRQALSNDV